MIFDDHEDIWIGENIIVDFSENDDMECRIKPIQSTPELCGEYAANVIHDALRTPDSNAIARNAFLLDMRKRITKNGFTIEETWEEIFGVSRSVDEHTMQELNDMCNKYKIPCLLFGRLLKKQSVLCYNRESMF